ncbi:MAG: helix-turn-helix transcriptional regulator, partial [Aristaeellaceae bacterium]
QRVFDWINATEPSSELDVQVVSATRGFLRTNDVLHDIVLYNPNTGFIYSARNHTYRNPGQMKDFDVEALLAVPEEEHLRFHLIDYDQGQALALLLPHRLQHGRLIMIFNIQRVAESVSAVLTESPVDGVATFVLDVDGQTVIMGAAPEGYVAGSGSGSAAWLRFLRDGCLDRSHTTSTQGWTVHAVLYMDSFMTTYMPFVKVVVLITALLFLILTVLMLVYSRFLRKPFSQLADTLRSSLPDGTLTEAQPSQSDSAILSELQSGIHYLLHQLALADGASASATDGRLVAWANALGSGRPVGLDRAQFFPKPALILGVARMIRCATTDYQSLRKQRQEAGDTLRSLLRTQWAVSYCILTDDGCFLLLVNDDAVDAQQLSALLQQATSDLQGRLNLTVTFAISPVMARDDEISPSLYSQLYNASAMGILTPAEQVCTLEDYQQYLQQDSGPNDNAMTQLLQCLPDGDEATIATAVSSYLQAVSALPEQRCRASLTTLLFTLISTYGKSLTTADYQTIQAIWSAGGNPARIRAELENVCLAIGRANARANDRSPQWHEIMLEISDFINNNLADPQLSVEMIAQKEGYSTNYVRSMFKTYVGVSITDSIRQRRMEKACDLLVQTDAPIHEIIAQCGFSNRSSFFTIFKNMMGMSPSEYRRQYRGPDAPA